MSVTSLNSLAQYSISALAQAFTPNWPVQNASDFVVTYTNPVTLADVVLVLNVDYFVTGAATAGVILAPTVTLEGSGIHYAVGGLLTVQRKPPATQPTTTVDGAKYLSAVPNNAYDWLCYSIQALYDIANRCLQVPATSPVQVPAALATRKGKLAGWDSSGNFTTYDAGGLGTQPFPQSLNPSPPIFLPGITAPTGGGATALDGLNVNAITTILLVIISINDNEESWKLRPFLAGDLNISDGVSTVVPVVNPNNLRWIRIS